MKKIVGTFHLFELHQSIFLIDEDKQSHIAICSLDDMANTITNLCHIHGVESVHLYGNNETAQEIALDIQKAGALKYNNFNINVEVN